VSVTHAAAGVSLHGGRHQAGEERMGGGGLALEFRVELYGHEPRMVGKFHDFHERAIGTRPRDHEAGLFQRRTVFGIEFVAMAVAFGNPFAAVRRRLPSCPR